MDKYELYFVVPGTLTDDEAKQRAEAVLALAQEYGSEAILYPLGKNRLAYPIQQVRYGYFYTAVFMAEPPAVVLLNTRLSLDRSLLRVMITHFNARQNAREKISYFTSTVPAGITTMTERAFSEREGALATFAPAPAPVAAPAAAPVVRPLDAGRLADINKKLDEIMEGDVIPGV